MRSFSKLSKFFIICAAVLVAGIICLIAGVAGGGVQDLDKVAEKYDWVQGDPGERGVTAQPVDEFRSVEISGDADVYLLGKGFYKNASRLTSDELLDSTELDLLGENKVIVIAGDKVPQPEIDVTDGVLHISYTQEEINGISLDASDLSWTPTVLVCCSMEMLDSLRVDGTAADLNCWGISWKNAGVKLTSGDIDMEGVTSGSLSMEITSGDAQLQGDFLKTTSITLTSGDVSIDTALSRAEYGLDLHADSGDITIREPGSEPEEYDDVPSEVKTVGGPHTITAKAVSGDLEISFGSGSGGMEL